MPEIKDIELDIRIKNVITRLKKYYNYSIIDNKYANENRVLENANIENSDNDKIRKTKISNKYAKLNKDLKDTNNGIIRNSQNGINDSNSNKNPIKISNKKTNNKTIKTLDTKYIKENIEKSKKLLKPYITYKDFDIEVKKDEVKLKDAFTIKSKDVVRLMKDCKKATLLALTIGSNFDNIAPILDAIGSEAAETLSQEFSKTMIKRLKLLGFKPTFRYGCGYGDWTIQDQKKIVKTLGTKTIKPLESGFVTPQKSITAIVGWKRI